MRKCRQRDENYACHGRDKVAERRKAECRRVLKPGGRLILLEHMDSDNKLAHALLRLLEPLTLRRLGDHLTRRTAEAAKQAGFHTVSEEKLFGDVVRMIITEKTEERQG